MWNPLTEVDLVDLRTSSSSAYGSEIQNGDFDADLEQWQIAVGNADYRKYMETGYIIHPGGIGYGGRSALFVFKPTVASIPMSDYWKHFLNPDPSFVRYGEISVTEELEKDGACDDDGTCNQCTAPWCNTDTVGPSADFLGYWVPPQCEDSPTECALAIFRVSGYDESYFEQTITNLGLKIIVGYFGYVGQDRVLRELKAAGRNVIFYYWGPEPFLVEMDAARVSLPDYYQGCDIPNTKNPRIEAVGDPVRAPGSLKCDFPEIELAKIWSHRVQDEAPAAHYLLQRIAIDLPGVQFMFSKHKQGTGTMESNAAACEWIKANEAKVSAWVKTKLPAMRDNYVCQGLQPTAVVAEDGVQPLVKLALRTWLTTALATQVGAGALIGDLPTKGG